MFSLARGVPARRTHDYVRHGATTLFAALIERCVAKCNALVLTLDLQILGQRRRDIHNGLYASAKPTLANLLNLVTEPRWCMGMPGTKRRSFGNIVGHAPGIGDVSQLSAWTATQFDPALS